MAGRKSASWEHEKGHPEGVQIQNYKKRIQKTVVIASFRPN